MEGDVSPIQIAAFLTALKLRGERVEDIVAAATVMRQKAKTITAPKRPWTSLAPAGMA